MLTFSVNPTQKSMLDLILVYQEQEKTYSKEWATGFFYENLETRLSGTTEARRIVRVTNGYVFNPHFDERERAKREVYLEESLMGKLSVDEDFEVDVVESLSQAHLMDTLFVDGLFDIIVAEEAVNYLSVLKGVVHGFLSEERLEGFGDALKRAFASWGYDLEDINFQLLIRNLIKKVEEEGYYGKSIIVSE